MTAEIAIINRSAVTLAADSAMTLSVRGAEKVYTSADKLFELSAHDPIGIMIYNNLEFLGAPLDVALKQFRDSRFCCPFDSLRDAPAALFDFLMTDFAPSAENQQKHARDLVMNVFRQIPDECINEAGRLIRKYPRKRPSVQEVFSSVVKAHLEEYEREPVADCFSDLTEDDLLSICGDAIDDAIKLLGDFPGTSGATEQLRRLGLLVLHRNVFSELLTGLVFAGFGKKEVFPSLIGYEIDGIIAGRMKKRPTQNVQTNRNQISAEIIPFAQRDIVDRYLHGIDPEFEQGFNDFVRTIMKNTSATLFDSIAGISKQKQRAIVAQLEASTETAVEFLHDRFFPEMKEKLRQQIEDMVLFMPKQELASLAEALVNITSLKRKFSAEQETVAGPIDVAVISKNDGFVWVRRKHYFSPELNLRYFYRKFGMNSFGMNSSSQRGGHGDQA